MEQLYVIVNQIMMLGVLVAVGFLAVRFKVIDEGMKDGIAQLVVKITLPMLIVTSVSTLELTPDMTRNGMVILISAYLSLLLLFLCGVATARLLKLQGKTKNVYTAYMMFGNIVFLGFPLFQALYPNGKGLFYAILFQIASDCFLWTLGVYLLSKHNDAYQNSSWKNMINANTIAFVLGISMFLTGIKLPKVLHDSFSGLGSTTTYLSMLFIGATLAGISLKGIYRRYSIFVLSAVKMVLFPAVVVLLLGQANRLLPLNINDVAKTVLVLQVGMPGMATVAVLARSFDSDHVYATEYVFVSTIFSLFTLPFVFYLANMLL